MPYPASIGVDTNIVKTTNAPANSTCIKENRQRTVTAPAGS
jgi:hypothetical protein